MKKNKNVFLIIIFLLIIASVGVCLLKPKRISGNYVSVYDKNISYEFKKDGTVIGAQYDKYSIDIHNLVTVLDVENSKDECEIGKLYKNYICLEADGELPKDYSDTTIAMVIGNVNFLYKFKEDMSFEFETIFDNEVLSSDAGTYIIDGKKVVCTSNDKVIDTFISIYGKVYRLEYIKEE